MPTSRRARGPSTNEEMTKVRLKGASAKFLALLDKGLGTPLHPWPIVSLSHDLLC